MMYWKLNCYGSNGVKHLSLVGSSSFYYIWEDIENTLGRAESGIKTVVLTNGCGRTWKMDSMEDAKNQLGIFFEFL